MRRCIRRYSLLVACVGLGVFHSLAQQDTLLLSAYLARVTANHPLALQSEQYPLLARAELQMARGGFDPIVKGYLSEKRFKDELYYDKRDLGIDIPIGGFFDVTAGYERMVGDFINPENVTTGGSLVHAGIKIPILRGLIIDDRQAALRQARMLPELGEAQRQEGLNKLVAKASKAYWNWWLASEIVRYLEEGVTLAAFRLDAVRASVANGDRAAIDTVEAYNEVLLRQLQLTDGLLLRSNARLAVESFLWDEELIPTQLPDSATPAFVLPEMPASLPVLLNYAASQHPTLTGVRITRDQLTIEERLAKWNRLPTLDFTYKPYLLSTGNSVPLSENYRLGLSLYFPILLRKERGKLARVQAKRTQADAMLSDTRRQIVVGLQQADNSLRTLQQTAALQAIQLQQTEQLLTGETIRFQNGESSLFLVNQRERSVLSARLKLAALQAKLQQAYIERLFAAGWPLEELAAGN